MPKLFLIHIFIIILSNTAYANLYPKIMSDFQSKFNFLEKSTNYGFLPDSLNCCSDEISGSGIEKQFNILFNRNIYQGYYLGLQLGYSQTDRIEFKNQRQELISIGGEPYQAIFSRDLELKMKRIHIALMNEYYFAHGSIINFNFMYSNSFDTEYNYAENLMFPEDRGVFKETNSRRRHNITETLQDHNSFHIALGYRYMLPMNKNNTLFIVPGINFDVALFNTNENIINEFSFSPSLSVKWTFGSDYGEIKNNIAKKSESNDEIIGNVDISTTGVKNDKEFFLNRVLTYDLKDSTIGYSADKIYFNFINNLEKEVKKWRFVIQLKEDQIIEEFGGDTNLPNFLVWDVNNDREFLQFIDRYKMLSSHYPPKFDLVLNYKLYVTDNSGNEYNIYWGILNFNAE